MIYIQKQWSVKLSECFSCRNSESYFFFQEKIIPPFLSERAAALTKEQWSIGSIRTLTRGYLLLKMHRIHLLCIASRQVGASVSLYLMGSQWTWWRWVEESCFGGIYRCKLTLHLTDSFSKGRVFISVCGVNCLFSGQYNGVT